jgi:hypothetical protein
MIESRQNSSSGMETKYCQRFFKQDKLVNEFWKKI